MLVLTRAQKGSGDLTVSTVKATGETLGLVATATPDEVDYALVRAREAHAYLRGIPAPRRGEVMRQIRIALANKLDDLGALISLEMGKVLAGAFSCLANRKASELRAFDARDSYLLDIPRS